ncbi:MAG: alpha/beta hydrolase [Cyclobacteriaceae bacterium]
MRVHLFFIAFFICVSAFSQSNALKKETLIYEDTLGLDVYYSKSDKTPRPLLVYVHGGGFSGGERDHPDHIRFCQRYAERGWTTATISYHLTRKGKGFSCDAPTQEKISTIKTAAQNTHQAIAFLIDRADKYRIDPSRVVLVGSSAGAEAVVQAVYWRETMKGILPEDFEYAGVVSMAGALIDINWITEETAIPAAFYHGTCDPLVPYGNAAHHYCDPEKDGFLMLHGSYSMAQKLIDLGKQYFLVTDCGGGHEWSSKPIDDKHISLLDDFLENDVLKGSKRQTHLVLSEGKRKCPQRTDLCE